MKISRVILLRHLLVWIVYIGYEIMSVQLTVGMRSSISSLCTYYAFYIGLFYFNAHIILDFAFFKTSRPYLFSIVLILLEISAGCLFKLGLDFLLSITKHPFTLQIATSRIYLVSNIFREIFFVGFSIAYWSMLSMMRFKERNYQMETEHLKNVAATLELKNRYISVENAYLQNQISPHLLFNSLNFIYISIHKLSERAGKGVMLLANIMRYSLVTGDDNRTVPLKTEVEQIENLIELSNLRFRNGLYLRFIKKGKISDRQILPLILITLVENVIKHGDLGEVGQPALVTLRYSDNLLIFETNNKKRLGSPHPKGGLGLKNIEKRLVNFYGEKYALAILDQNDSFKVTLTLNL